MGSRNGSVGYSSQPLHFTGIVFCAKICYTVCTYSPSSGGQQKALRTGTRAMNPNDSIVLSRSARIAIRCAERDRVPFPWNTFKEHAQ